MMIHESIDIWRYLSARMVKIIRFICRDFLILRIGLTVYYSSLVNSKHFIIPMIDKKKRSFMSEIHSISSIKEKKRPSVSPKCLLNIKSIVTHNVSLNNNPRNISSRSAPPPLPLAVAKELNDQDENHHTQSQTSANGIRQKSDFLDGHDRSIVENNRTIHPSPIEDHQDSSPRKSAIVPKESNSEQYLSTKLNHYDSSIVPPLPLCSSMYPFASSSSSPREKPLASFPVQSSNRINEGYLAQMRRIIASSSSSSSEVHEETKLIESPIHHQKTIPIKQMMSISPTISKLDDENRNDAKVNNNGPLVFVNSSLKSPIDTRRSSTVPELTALLKPHFSEGSEQRPPLNHPTNFIRLPHLLRNSNPPIIPSSSSTSVPRSFINHPHHRRSMPSFESPRTSIPVEMLNCCQTETISSGTERRSLQRNSRQHSTTIENTLSETEARANYFRNVEKTREIMLQVSKRLTQDLISSSTLPIVDTHCHFDLIFDRLRIKHNNLKKYFLDYSEYYPPGLSFELAIQVFWRPNQLLEENWVNWFSKYLDDERVYGACGIHPHWSSAWTESSSDDIQRCLRHPKIVAIGEIGLDFGPKNLCTRHEQYRAFEGQLKIAAKSLKPIVIHSRDAYIETFELLKKHLQSDHKIHLHCFVGNMNDVHLFTSYFTEIKFGFTPIITRSNFLHSVLEQVQIDQILSETDSPYFTPEELQKYSRSAHPGMVYSVVEMIAQLRHLPVLDVACQLRENARQIYGV